jgi:hypothetical protein
LLVASASFKEQVDSPGVAAAIYRMLMLLKELHPAWPPTVHDLPNAVKPDPRDVVASVENKSNGKLVVRLRKFGNRGQEYCVTLTVPENVLQKTLLTIIRKRGMTLGEVGEIPIL